MSKNGVQDYWSVASEDQRYGVYHDAVPTTAGFQGEILFVFVHGLTGNCRSTFGDLPRFLTLDRLGIDVDALAFSFPTWPWQEADISFAANELRLLLKEKYRTMRNVFFFTHSTGGLVVKEALRQDRADTAAAIATGQYVNSESLLLRTRRIFNFSVPHQGANLTLTLVLRTASGGNLVLSTGGLLKWCGVALGRLPSMSRGLLERVPRLKGCGAVLERMPAWGRNRLLGQLYRHNAWARKLEDDYNRMLEQELGASGLPRPISVEIAAAWDEAIEKYSDKDPVASGALFRTRSDANNLVARGTHSDAKIPESPNDLAVTFLVNRLRPLADARSLACADRTISRCLRLEAAEQFPRLLSGAVGEGGVAGAQGADQRTVSDRLIALARSQSERPRRMVVTGDAGVGKSLVLRHVTKSLAVGFLTTHGEQEVAPLPVTIPLQQVTLSGDEEARFCGLGRAGEPVEVITEWWCRWANKLIATAYQDAADATAAAEPSGLPAANVRRPRLEAAWLHGRIQGHPTVVILDGVDEFIGNHDEVDHQHVQSLVDGLLRLGSDNGKLTVIVGARSSQPNLGPLAGGMGTVVEVLPPSPEQAERAFPGARTLLERAGEGLHKVLLTPLFLAQLAPRADSLPKESLATELGITQRAMEALVDRMLDAAPPGRRDGRPTTVWLDAGMLVAWRFFEKFRGEMTRQALVDECVLLREKWSGHLRTSRLAPGGEAILRAFDVVIDDDDWRDLLLRTVFFPTGQGGFRFRHQTWEYYLVARYLETCIRFGYVADLLPRAFNLYIYRFAGELLGRTEINEELVQRVLEQCRTPDDQSIVGNFAAVVGNSLAPITGPAVPLLINGLDDFQPTAHHVALSSFSHRGLRADPQDTSAVALRRELLPVFERYADASMAEANRVTTSLAWCYHRSYAAKFGVEGPAHAWRGLGTSERDANDAVLLSCAPVGNPARGRTLHRSTQIGFLRVPQVATRNPSHTIAAAHYLYALAVTTARNRTLDSEIPLLLPLMLLDDSPIGKQILACRDVPELAKVFRAAQRAYHGTGPTQPSEDEERMIVPTPA